MTLTIYFEGTKYFSMTFVVDSVKRKKTFVRTVLE